MLSVQNYGTVNQSVGFKAKKADENFSYRQKSGLKTGGVAYAVPAAFSLGALAVSKAMSNWGKNVLKTDAKKLGEDGVKELKAFLSDYDTLLKGSGKKMLIAIPLGFAICMGCGALIDKLANKKRAKLEEELARKGQKDTLKDNKRAEVTRSGGVYYKSNTGKKYGALLGLVVMPAWKYAGKILAKSKNSVGIISSAVVGAIGGYILGSITDKHSNKAAKKIAEKSVN